MIKRFESKYIINKKTDCWEWIAGRDGKGYGSFWYNRKGYIASRISMMLYKDFDLNSKDCVLHKCDNTKCVNPDHLFLGTQKDNIKDRDNKKRHGFGEKNGRCILTEKQVIKIFFDNRPVRLIAKEYKVHTTTIKLIKNKTNWKHLNNEHYLG